MGATFIKFGRAPTTLMTFSMSSNLKVRGSGFKRAYGLCDSGAGTPNLQADDLGAAVAALLARQRVARVHDHLREPAHPPVVDHRVVRHDHRAVRPTQLLVAEPDRPQRLAAAPRVRVVEAHLPDVRVV